MSNQTILTAANVTKTFRMGESVIEVLKGVDLSLNAGEFLAIEGRSGSGKSTLLHILSALDECNSGSIHYDGRDIAGMSPKGRCELRNAQFGFVFQFYYLLPELNVLENTLLPAMVQHSVLSFRRNSGALRKRAIDVLTELGMEHRLKHKPQQLSGGERQRVAVVRALINGPMLLLADEPTGSLDHSAATNLGDLLLELNKEEGVALVLVTHSLELAKCLPRTVELRDGRLA